MKLLLVEDNAADVRLIREMLQESSAGPFELENATRLDTAIGRLRRAEAFDAVLLDLGLPDSQGMKTLAATQEAAMCLPVVVLTGRDDQAFAKEAVRAGAQDYLVKGRFDADALVRTIHYAIERKRLEQSVAERTEKVRELAEQLRALASELTQTEQRERERLARILHDHIQQLLVSAQLQLSLVKRGDAKIVQSVAQGIDSTLKEALTASRSLTVELCPPVLHHSGLAAALSWLAARMEEKQQFRVYARATNEAEPATPEVRAFLFEATRELLLNSLKHSGTREAHVTMSRVRPRSGTQKGTDNDCCRIVVEDKGNGFDPASVKPGPSGGFGLFSIQQRLLYMGGRLKIESAPGQGARVTLTIPIGRAAAPALSLLPGAAGGPSFGPGVQRISVLLADDHQIMRQGLSSLLQCESDIEVIAEAENGKRALELARQHKPDVIVMDVNMPEMNGIEVTRILTKEMPETKVIGLSVLLDGEAANAMREAGAVAYLTKGGPSEDLVEAIRACCPLTSH